MILDLVTEPNDILRRKSQEVAKITPEISQLIFDMKETMKVNEGVGLAAPQVGKNLRIFVMETQDGTVALINPEIIKKSFFKEFDEEGCLSIPGVFIKVKRSKAITVKAVNEQGRELTIDAKGFMARVIQHEIDHLDGILMLDRIKNRDKAVVVQTAQQM